MLKAAVRSILKNKQINLLTSQFFETLGQKQLSYRVQKSGNFLPEFVSINLPSEKFNSTALCLYCAGGKDQMSRAAAAFGWKAPESPMPALLHSLLSPDGVFFDVGANSGYYSMIALASRNRPAKIFAFEPSLDALKFLNNNLESNALGGEGFELITMALSDSVGTAELYYPVNTHNLLETSQTLVKNHKGRTEYDKTHSVDVTTVDDIVKAKGLTRLDLIKIDVEGHEEAVLTGASQTIEQLRPIIFFEVLQSSEMRNVQNNFETHNYDVFKMLPNAVSKVDEISHASENRNQIAVPSEKKEYFLQKCKEANLFYQ